MNLWLNSLTSYEFVVKFSNDMSLWLNSLILNIQIFVLNGV